MTRMPAHCGKSTNEIEAYTDITGVLNFYSWIGVIDSTVSHSMDFKTFFFFLEKDHPNKHRSKRLVRRIYFICSVFLTMSKT